jgi:hypothetical protein
LIFLKNYAIISTVKEGLVPLVTKKEQLMNKNPSIVSMAVTAKNFVGGGKPNRFLASLFLLSSINGRLRMSGVKKLVFALACIVSFSAMARNVYITPDADGTGDGTSWESPMMLTNYFRTAMKSGDIVRIKAGKYTGFITSMISIGNCNLTISGGYAGIDDDTLDTGNPISEIDFAHSPTSQNYSPFAIKNGSGYSVKFERLLFKRARSAVFHKTATAGNLYLSDCVIVSNGWRNYSGSNVLGGRGIHSEGGKIFMTNCVVAYSGMYSYVSGTSGYGDHGFGAYFKNTTVEMVGCKFVGNGSQITQKALDSASRTIRSAGKGMAVYVTGTTTLKAMNCDFVCNKAPMGWYDKNVEQTTALGSGLGAGGIVAFYSASGSASFSNCSFVANMNVRDYTYGRYNVKFGGALAVAMTAPDKIINVDNCTFAYNMTDSPSASPGIDIWRGIVNVRNSIFVGNNKVAASTVGSDIHVRTGAVVNVSHTMFDANGTDDDRHFTIEQVGEDSGRINFGEGVLFGDPLLASETLASTNLIVNANKKIQSLTVGISYYNVSRIEEVLAFDVHLRSKAGRWTSEGYVSDRKTSPAIDAGDASLPYADEPSPNGFRLNLGRYGGTLEASLTHSGLVFRVR